MFQSANLQHLVVRFRFTSIKDRTSDQNTGTLNFLIESINQEPIGIVQQYEGDSLA